MKRSIYLFQIGILLILLLVGHVFAQNPKMDSLKKVIATTKSDTTKLKSMTALAEVMIQNNHLVEARQWVDQSIHLAQDAHLSKYKVKAYLMSGRLHQTQNQQQQALDDYLLALETAERAKDLKLMLKAYKQLAEVYDALRKFHKSLECLQKALKISESIRDPQMNKEILAQIGYLHRGQGNFQKGIDYMLKALTIAQTLPDSSEQTPIYFNAGDTYRTGLHQYRLALEYYHKALAIDQKKNNFFGIALINMVISATYIDSGSYAKGIQYANESIKLAKQIDKQKIVMDNYANLGHAYFKMNRLPEARKYAQEAFDYYLQTEAVYLKKDMALILTQIDSSLGNFRSAYEWQRKYKLFSDSLADGNNRQELGRLEAQYEFDKQNEARQKAEAQAQARRMQLYYLFGGIFALVLLLTGFTYYRYRSKAKTNRVLNEKNEQITAQNSQILTQKAELENAYEELNATLEQIQTQKQVIEQKNHKIEDSIRYAYQIQTAILPDPAFLQSVLPPHFIFYQPKDIVSGDFYWASVRDNRLFFCVADCTGHGVPGAFMSVVGGNALHHAINELDLNEPDIILYELDRKIKATLRQEKTSDSKDGMDIALCVLEGKTLHYAGAGRPLYHYSNGILIETKGDKFPIGGGQFEQKAFTAHTFSLQQGDRIYLFSDGITDQFGGANKKKFTPKRLQEFILTHQNLSIQERGILFNETMHQWMSGQSQLDDLTLMGLEIR